MIRNYTGISGSRVAWLIAEGTEEKVLALVSTGRAAERLAADLSFCAPAAEILVHHRAPFPALRLGDFRVAVPRKIHEIERIVQPEIVDGLRLSGLFAYARKGFSLHKRIDERRLPHV